MSNQTYEYKVLRLNVKDCEQQLNQFAKDGWRLAAMVSDTAKGLISGGLILTLEREIARPL